MSNNIFVATADKSEIEVIAVQGALRTIRSEQPLVVIGKQVTVNTELGSAGATALLDQALDRSKQLKALLRDTKYQLLVALATGENSNNITDNSGRETAVVVLEDSFGSVSYITSDGSVDLSGITVESSESCGSYSALVAKLAVRATLLEQTFKKAVAQRLLIRGKTSL